ncbi:MAG TPA: hypothetical protein VHN11_20025 [Xanthobacteraceae bacterium]|jgi:hypothetical protein|nr:hypothetical protein [Xanthobacteraceae bacterium]
MRKGVIFLAVLAAASAPSFAFAKHAKKHTMKMAAAAPADPNENGRRLVANGLMQIFVPLQSMAQQGMKK